MGLLRNVTRLGRRLLNASADDPQGARSLLRICRIEEMESRRCMSADLHVGSVYLEQASGDDTLPNLIQFTFEGGVPGTELTKIIIDTDKDGKGLSAGDLFFDTANGGLGSFKSSPLQIVSHDGFQVIGTSVVDGGTNLEIDLKGFNVGEKLVISIDVDEAQFVDDQGNIDTNAVVEGGEFQRSHFIASFTAPHFQDITTSTLYWDAFDKNFATSEEQTGTHLNLPNDKYLTDGDLTDLTAGAVASAVQIPLPITIAGTVYVDGNLNNHQESGEPGIGSVTLSLWQFNGSTYVSTGVSTTTDAQGHYKFTGVLPGTYQIVETQPAGYFSVGSSPGTVNGTVDGVVVNADVLSQIALLGGDDSVHNDFAEALPNSISGHVHNDVDGNCDTNPDEPGIAGVTIQLLDANGKVIRTTKTDAKGMYEFDNLAPGAYGIHEIQPAGFLQEDANPGSAGGVALDNDTINRVVLGSGVVATNYNFCEVLPSSISGYVHNDVDGNCDTNPNEPGIAGVVIQLINGHGVIIATTTTDGNGFYHFDNLRTDTYTVHEIQPTGYLQEDANPGSAGGVATNNDTIAQIELGRGIDAVHYNFCEVLPSSISGYVHSDVDGNCDTNPNEPGIAGVTMQLLDSNGHVIATTTTDETGFYKFDNLLRGTYTVHEIQPAGYLQEDANPGSAGGVATNSDTIAQITLPSGLDAVHYNFCEVLPSSLSGYVHNDVDGNCDTNPNEPGIAGVTIQLINGHGVIIATTTTDENGFYEFDNLVRGTYTVHEIQPAGYLQEDANPGSAGGVATNSDTIAQITLPSGLDAVHYNFCEVLPSSLSGYVHNDVDGNCDTNPNEPGIAGVTIQLINGHGVIIATTTTDENGFYEFDNLVRGTYTVHEIQPAGYLQEDANPGSAGGVATNSDTIAQITLPSGLDAVHYNFCEVLPSSLSGYVHNDVDGNCDTNPNEPGIAGVTIQLINGHGVIIATTTTDASGYYHFDHLSSGAYTVHEIQPAGYFSEDANPGSAGGVASDFDTISEITLPAGFDAVSYNFCELAPGTISGHVFQDGPPITVNGNESSLDLLSQRDGIFKPGDKLLGGVTLELRNGVTGEPILGSAALPGYYAANHLIRTVTDANGYYQFVGLPRGNYAVFEVQPDGYIDGLDTPGSLGGIAINLNAQVSVFILEALTVAPHDDAILRIALPAGQTSINNNFSELATIPVPPPATFIPPPPIFIPRSAAPAAMLPPNPPIITQVFYSAPMLVQQLLYGSGGRILNYTWHLSVINAGQPRGGASDALMRVTGMPPDSLAWNEVKMSESDWSLPGGESQTKAAKRMLFGMKNGIPITGDFNGDGRTDVGIYLAGQWFIDVNGNGEWDEGDLWAKLGYDGDRPVTGDWDGDGKTDIGVFGRAWPGDPRAVREEPGLPDPHNPNTGVLKNVPPSWRRATYGVRSLKLTSTGKVRADLIDHVFHYGTPKDYPVIGDWNGDGIDTIAVFHDGSWYRDLDGNGKWSTNDAVAQFGQKGDVPVVGDWNGDGIDEVGVYRNGVWYLDTNGNGRMDEEDEVVKLGGGDDVPVVGDWDGDGRDSPGVYHEGQITRTNR